MNIKERVRNMIRNWLQIQPAAGQTITIRESVSWQTNCMRNRVWYRGDAGEIEQLFKALGSDSVGSARFWAAAPSGNSIRKAHSGLPAVMVDTLAYLVKSDLGPVQFADEKAQAAKTRWKEMEKECSFRELVGEAVSAVLAMGDGAFKISIDKEVSSSPILEFWPADRVEYITKHGRITGVIFKSRHEKDDVPYELREIYEPGSVRYELYAEDRQVPLHTVPQLAEYKPVQYEGSFTMAIPLIIFKSQKYPGRGRSVFDSKTDAFDSHDEIISQWVDAVRSGRVQNYIPEDMIPRDPKNGTLVSTAAVNRFGTDFIQIQSSNKENSISKIETVQPEIRYDAFLQTYAATLDMCLQGVMSPATLGINVGKMSSAESQREKKDITGITRNTITDALERVLPQVVQTMLMVEDLMNSAPAGIYNAQVSFGEYGAPDFDSRVQTVGSAATTGVMSVQAQVEELWGPSKDEEWKKQEVRRLLHEKGIEEMAEPAVGEQDPYSGDL